MYFTCNRNERGDLRSMAAGVALMGVLGLPYDSDKNPEGFDPSPTLPLPIKAGTGKTIMSNTHILIVIQTKGPIFYAIT